MPPWNCAWQGKPGGNQAIERLNVKTKWSCYDYDSADFFLCVHSGGEVFSFPHVHLRVLQVLWQGSIELDGLACRVPVCLWSGRVHPVKD